MPTENFLSSLVINKVDTYETFSKMMEKEGVVNDNELYLIEQDGGFEGSIEQIQADWNQNDSEALDYVKNRTHWSEVNLIPSIGNTTLQFPSEENGSWIELPVEYFNVYDYSTYCVMWDGVEYKCSLHVTDDDIAVLGGYDNGYPFQLVGASDWCNVYAYNENGDYDYNSTHTLTVSAMIETVHKLDPKYLPDSANTFFVHFTYAGEEYTCSETFAEIDAAVTSGKFVVGVTNEPVAYCPIVAGQSGEYGYYKFVLMGGGGNPFVEIEVYDGGGSTNWISFATREDVDEAIATIPTPDVSGQINAHNADTEAHADIREAILANKIFIVAFTSDDNGGYSCDKTFTEIKAAVNNKQTVVGLVDGEYWYDCVRANEVYVEFCLVSESGVVTTIGVDDQYGVTVGIYDLAENVDIDGPILLHNLNPSAHADIRQAASAAQTAAQEAKTEAQSKAPMYDYGTTDLTAGTSPLESGKLYFVYE